MLKNWTELPNLNADQTFCHEKKIVIIILRNGRKSLEKLLSSCSDEIVARTFLKNHKLKHKYDDDGIADDDDSDGMRGFRVHFL